MGDGGPGRPVSVLPLWQRGPVPAGAAGAIDGSRATGGADRPGVHGHSGPVGEGGGAGQLTATADQAAATAAYSALPAP
ncbi:hypothetical protein GCM10010505_19660 [Kitasatospora aburaviensis]